MSDSSRPHGLQPTRLLRPWDFPGKRTGVGCHCLLWSFPSPRALILYVPLTTQNRQSPYEVVLPGLPFLDRDSVANVRGLGALPTVRCERKLGTLSEEVMRRIKRALSFALDL